MTLSSSNGDTKLTVTLSSSKMPITLRPYQNECVETIMAGFSQKKSQLVSMIMGTGKTETFMEICKRFLELYPDANILIVLNKVLLVEQTVKRISAYLPFKQVGVYCGSLGSKDVSQITVASVQSVFGEDLSNMSLLIFDECHRITESDDSQYGKLLSKIGSDSKIIGFTATPYRAFGYIYGNEGDLFDSVDFSYPINQAIEDGYLVKPTLQAGTQRFETENLGIKLGDYDQGQLSELVKSASKAQAQVAESMLRLTGRKSVAWACSTIEHCELISSLIPEESVVVHSKLSKSEQDENKKKFETGLVRHVCFVTMLSEGIDIPRVDSIVLLRPTRSPVLALQTIGRALRPFEDKKDALILDFGRVIEHVGPLDNPRIPKKGERKGEPVEELVKACSNCLTYNPIGAKVCSFCGLSLVKEEERTVGKNLTHKPDVVSDILSVKKDYVFECYKTTLHKHISREKNNLCLLVKFHVMDLKYMEFNKFFVIGYDFAKAKAIGLLQKLGVDVLYSDLDNLDYVISKTVKNCPKQLIVKLDGKYPEIKSLIFNDRDSDTKSNSGMAEHAAWSIRI